MMNATHGDNPITKERRERFLSRQPGLRSLGDGSHVGGKTGKDADIGELGEHAIVQRLGLAEHRLRIASGKTIEGLFADRPFESASHSRVLGAEPRQVGVSVEQARQPLAGKPACGAVGVLGQNVPEKALDLEAGGHGNLLDEDPKLRVRGEIMADQLDRRPRIGTVAADLNRGGERVGCNGATWFLAGQREKSFCVCGVIRGGGLDGLGLLRRPPNRTLRRGTARRPPLWRQPRRRCTPGRVGWPFAGGPRICRIAPRWARCYGGEGPGLWPAFASSPASEVVTTLVLVLL
jgi:hypothetical protein